MNFNSFQGSTYESPSFQARYNFYDGNKHDKDYLYPVSRYEKP